jgi:hypothetical protein
MIEEELRAAYHEAAHIIMAWRYYLSIGEDGVWIKPDPKRRGKFIGECDISRPDSGDLNRTDFCLYMLFAGFLSENKLLCSINSTDQLDTRLSAEDDCKKINNIFEEQNQMWNHEIKYRKYKQCVIDLLDKQEIWNAVKVVANKLIEKRHLKKPELYEIMNKLSLRRINLTGDLYVS